MAFTGNKAGDKIGGASGVTDAQAAVRANGGDSFGGFCNGNGEAYGGSKESHADCVPAGGAGWPATEK